MFRSYHSAPHSQTPQCYPKYSSWGKMGFQREQEPQTRVHTQTPNSIMISCYHHFSCNSLLIPASTRKRTRDQRKMKDEKRRELMHTVFSCYLRACSVCIRDEAPYGAVASHRATLVFSFKNQLHHSLTSYILQNQSLHALTDFVWHIT